MKLRLFAMLLFFLILNGCATGQKTASTFQPSQTDHGLQSFNNIKEALDRGGDIIDYDTLLWIHKKMTQNQPKIPRSGDLFSALIMKRNDNPRIDNMILILAAHTIGNSQAVIDGVYGLFESMLNMDHRLNSWVLAYIGDAIGKYPYDIAGVGH